MWRRRVDALRLCAQAVCSNAVRRHHRRLRPFCALHAAHEGGGPILRSLHRSVCTRGQLCRTTTSAGMLRRIRELARHLELGHRHLDLRKLCESVDASALGHACGEGGRHPDPELADSRRRAKRGRTAVTQGSTDADAGRGRACSPMRYPTQAEDESKGCRHQRVHEPDI